MKKIFSLLMAVLLVVSGTTINASARVVNPDDLVSPQYVVVCPNGTNGGKHDMVANGVAYVFSGPHDGNPGNRLFNGYAWRCSACGEMVATEGSPLISGTIGRYATGYHINNEAYAHFYGGITGTCYGDYKQHSYFKYCLFRYAS